MRIPSAQLIVRRIRQIGIARMLFGIDRAGTPAEIWQTVAHLPLSTEELRQIAENVAPYLR